MESASFRFAHDLTLRISGDRAVLRHARREYGPAEEVETAAAPDVAVRFGPVQPQPDTSPDASGRGGHKTVAWRVAVGDPGAPLTAAIQTSGWPRSFARSLVQGYVVEPILSVAAARRGMVLVPGAGIGLDEGLVLLLGRSRAGKSTLAARSLAAGRVVLGDDQLFVDANATAWPFPRSLRFYPDLEDTAPTAWSRLPSATRRALRLRGVVATVSRGFVRPSLAVPAAALGRGQGSEPARIARIVLIERDADRSDLTTEPSTPEAAVDWAARLLGEQRERLARLGGSAWAEALERTADSERVLLGRAFAGIAVEHVAIPRAWDARTAVAATARWLSI